jgi:hypothetical protein
VAVGQTAPCAEAKLSQMPCLPCADQACSNVSTPHTETSDGYKSEQRASGAASDSIMMFAVDQRAYPAPSSKPKEMPRLPCACMNGVDS